MVAVGDNRISTEEFIAELERRFDGQASAVKGWVNVPIARLMRAFAEEREAGYQAALGEKGVP